MVRPFARVIHFDSLTPPAPSAHPENTLPPGIINAFNPCPNT